MHDSSPALSDVTEMDSPFVPVNRDWCLPGKQALAPTTETSQRGAQASIASSGIGDEPTGGIREERVSGASTPGVQNEGSKPSIPPRKRNSVSISPSKVRKASVSPSKAKRTIAASPAEASAEDKLMIYLKEEEHQSWSKIKLAIEELTGKPVNQKSLSKRYSRLKNNFGANEFDEEDIPYVLQCKKEIEEKFQNELCTRISDALCAMGRPYYPAGVIKKKIRELV
ncbi:hypothetical protein KEM54_000176 [Ascosphaera aggregata]|nr:hypothetical protein KEM54_000176 [Ascosphaera aggregata]